MSVISLRVVVAAAATVLLVGAIVFTLAGPQSSDVMGQSGSYYYVFSQVDGVALDAPYMVEMYITDQGEDYSVYKTENDSRIDDWDLHPGSAPQVDGKPVRVTFLTPQSYTETLQVVGPYAGEYLRYRVVGSSASYPDRAMDGIGEIDPALIGPEVPDPACGLAVDEFGTPDPTACEPINYTGVIHVQFSLQGGVAGLVALRDDPDVYLADSTGIVVVDELAAQHGIDLDDISVVSMPFAIFDDDVTFP
jgi:hypothetical protein